MNHHDKLAASIKRMPLRSPSAGFDGRLLARLRAEKAWRRVAGFAFAWSCAGTAAVAVAPSWLGLSIPNAAQAKVWAAAQLIEAVRWASWTAQGLSSFDAPRLAIQLLAATILALSALKALAPRSIKD
jgi:hypothetical protein